MKDKFINRRSAIKGLALGAGLFNIVPRHVLGGPGYTAPSEKLTRAIIGVGNQGRRHIEYPGSEIVAICDVKKSNLERGMTACKKRSYSPKSYTDFREVLAQPGVDIVSIVTPPHWHGLMAVAAAKAGKDVWCEKPMTRTIAEGQHVVEACQRYGTIFRINTWYRFRGRLSGFGASALEMRKVVQSKLLGWPLKVVVSKHTGCDWKINTWCGQFNAKPSPVPEDIDYNMWLGPAPWKPYTNHRTNGSFRGYWDYDGGGLGDMGQHFLDPIQYILGKDHTSPVKIEVDTDPQHPDVVKPWRKVVLTYEDGCQIILDGDNSMEGAPTIEGPNGKIFKNLKSTIPNLRSKMSKMPNPEPMVTDFHEAVRSRKKFGLDEVKGHRSTTLVNLAVTAVRLNRTLNYDPVAERFINDDEANRYVEQPMRGPWNFNEGGL